MRHTAAVLAAVLLAVVGAVSPAAGPTARAAVPEPKVVIIVGATHGSTSTYRSYGDGIYQEALKYTSNVVRVYSPNATWTAVKNAVNGANVIVYLGHGNGWPSPYTYDPNFTTKDGFGLNETAGSGDYNNKYYGEPYIRTLTPAPNAVVLLFHLCYASGNSEPGYPEPSLSVARERVDNYGAAFLQTGIRAVIADGHNHTGYIDALFSTDQTVEQAWRTHWNANGHVRTYASGRTPGMTYQMDPDTSSSGYYRSIVGDMSLTTGEVTGAAYVDTGADPDTYVAPGAASSIADGTPIYDTSDDAIAAQNAGAGSLPSPLTTIPVDTALRVLEILETGGSNPVIRVRTLDDAVTGWIPGESAVPRDSRSPGLRSVDDGGGLLTPNGDGNLDTYHLTAEISESTAWSLTIKSGSGTTMKSASGNGATAAITWDGLVSGTLQPDGVYNWRLVASDEWGNPPLDASGTLRMASDPLLVERLAGRNRFATAAEISKATFNPGVEVAFVANGFNFPDALAGAAAAGKLGAPVLLVGTDYVPAETAAELTRLSPGKVVVLGGTSSVNDATMMELMFN